MVILNAMNKEEPKQDTTPEPNPTNIVIVDDDYNDDDHSWDYDDSDDDNEEDELERAMDECGQIRGGGCMLAGTEFCDWECPFSSMVQIKRDGNGRFCK